MLLGTGNWDERVYLFKINQLHLSLLLEEWKGHMSRPNDHYLSRIATGDSRTRPASGNREYETNRSSRSGVRTRQTMVTRLRISMRPFRARIHLRRRWGRVTLILSHVMALRLVGRVGGRIGRAGSRDWGIYRNVCVRLHVVGVRAMVIELTIAATEGGVHRRTCCLNHTCRAAGLCVRRVMVLRRAT